MRKIIITLSLFIVVTSGLLIGMIALDVNKGAEMVESNAERSSADKTVEINGIKRTINNAVDEYRNLKDGAYRFRLFND